MFKVYIICKIIYWTLWRGFPGIIKLSSSSIQISTHTHTCNEFCSIRMQMYNYMILWTNLLLPRVTIVEMGCSRGIFFIGAGITFLFWAACDNITDGMSDFLRKNNRFIHYVAIAASSSILWNYYIRIWMVLATGLAKKDYSLHAHKIVNWVPYAKKFEYTC